MSATSSSHQTFTDLIDNAASGGDDARAALYAHAYPELRKLAHTWLYRHGGNTHLQATEILSEGYLRFIHTGELRLQDRASFFALASSIIRSVIFDTVRRACAEKRGGDQLTALNTEIGDSIGAEDVSFLALEQALLRLETLEPRLAKVVDMHFFCRDDDARNRRHFRHERKVRSPRLAESADFVAHDFGVSPSSVAFVGWMPRAHQPRLWRLRRLGCKPSGPRGQRSAEAVISVLG
jgi:RNA polymerase sigma factor (TIGR02999 family)